MIEQCCRSCSRPLRRGICEIASIPFISFTCLRCPTPPICRPWQVSDIRDDDLLSITYIEQSNCDKSPQPTGPS